MSVGTGPAGDQALVREVIARLGSTLAASSARVELRSGFDDLIPPSRLLPPEDHDPGRPERLVTGAARLAWKHAVPEKWRGWWREMEASLVTAGFAEHAAGRYLVSNGKSATVCTGGQHYTGSPGQPLPEGRQPGRRERRQPGRVHGLDRRAPCPADRDRCLLLA